MLESQDMILNLEPACWVWCDHGDPNTYCYARGKMLFRHPLRQAILRIVADSRYQVWVNGAYIGQGPVPFKRPFLYVDSYDVTAYLRTGENVVAVMGNYHGVKHCTYTPGIPGILADLRGKDLDGNPFAFASDSRWKALAVTAYEREVPRRTWATAWCESYDARREIVNWREPGFDDGAWPVAKVMNPGSIQLHPRTVSPLREWEVEAVRLTNVWILPSGKPVLSGRQGITGVLDTEPLEVVPDHARSVWFQPLNGKGWLPARIPSASAGLGFAVDFGEEIVGQIELDVDAPAGVVIDLAPAECLREGRPWCHRKGGEYGRRYITRKGRQQWRCFGYDGLRYLYAVVRGPHPDLTFHRLGVWRRESALPIRATFDSDDPVANRIWKITTHTVQLCSQDLHIDCPTREQTVAWGDHVWSGFWAAYLTGDASALRHLLLSAEQTQGPARDSKLPDGQIPCYPYSEVDDGPLYDYSLIFVWGIWLYYQITGDHELAGRLIPVADRVLTWYRKRIGSSGLIEVDGDQAFENWKNRIDGAEKGQLFIDHPGLGSHRCPNHCPGLDRRGISAALNFFFIHALDALGNICGHLKRTDRANDLKAEADRMRRIAEDHFYNPRQELYVDAFVENRSSGRISQQINALAITSGTCPPQRAVKILERILDETNPQLCLAGTYFWTYVAMALCESGQHPQMWSHVAQRWNRMAEKGATSWWETFLGDDLDSLCHIWSCVPGYLMMAEILGVKPAAPGFSRILISPRVDLIERVHGRIPLPGGEVRIDWHRPAPGQCELRVELLADSVADLVLPSPWFAVGQLEPKLHLAAYRTANLLLRKPSIFDSLRNVFAPKSIEVSPYSPVG
jgi:hypothetical protein